MDKVTVHYIQTLTQMKGTDEEISSLNFKSINSPVLFIIIFVNEMAAVGAHALIIFLLVRHI